MTNVLETFAFKLTEQDIKEILLDKREVEVNYTNGDILCIAFQAGNHAPVGHVDYITVYYGVKDVVEGDIQYYREGSTFYSIDHVDKAVKAFTDRVNADNPKKVIEDGESFNYIATRARKSIHFDNHFVYIDEVGPYFLSYLTSDAVENCRVLAHAIATANGKETYKFHTAFIKGMVKINHGTLVHVLRLVDTLKDIPAKMSDTWIVENYHNKYAALIEKAEQQLLEEVYLKD